MNNRRITLMRPSQVFDSFMDEFFNAPSWSGSTNVQVNMHEDENNLNIEIKAPVFKKDEVNIEVEGETLKIHAKKESENKQEDENKKYYMHEFASEEVQRVISLPVKVDSENAEAKAEDGVIKIKIPKLPESKAKKISINTD